VQYSITHSTLIIIGRSCHWLRVSLFSPTRYCSKHFGRFLFITRYPLIFPQWFDIHVQYCRQPRFFKLQLRNWFTERLHTSCTKYSFKNEH
jgi:hypothetical protein